MCKKFSQDISILGAICEELKEHSIEAQHYDGISCINMFEHNLLLFGQITIIDTNLIISINEWMQEIDITNPNIDIIEEIITFIQENKKLPQS